MRRSALLVVCLAVFVDMLGFGIILPVLPFYALDLGATGAWVGALLSAYAAAQFLTAPVLGSLSDRYGRRRLLLLSLAGSMVSLALTGLAGSLVLLLLARVAAGGFGGAIGVGQAYAVDLVEPNNRTRALGLIGASIGLGFVFGPAIGAGLSAAGMGFAGICFVAAGLAAVNLLLGLWLLPRPPAGLQDVGGARSVGGPSGATAERTVATALRWHLHALRSALSHGALRRILIAVFAVTFAFVGMEATFALLGERRYGLGPAGLGVVFTAIGVVMVIVQGGLVGRLSDRYGDRAVAVAGALLLGAGLVVLPFVPAWVGYTALGVVAIGQGLLSTTTAALIAGVAGRQLGGAFGVGQSAAAAARAVGPVAAGVAFDVQLALPYAVGAALCFVAAALVAAMPAATGRGAAVAAGEPGTMAPA